MNENLGKKITLTIVLAVAAILCLVLPKKPFRLGLDLQGGTRVVARFDFEEALKQNRISLAEYNDRPTLLQEMCVILRGRIDPNGVFELSVRPEGTDRIVIEIPGVAELASTTVTGNLAAALDATAEMLTLEGLDVEGLKAFPQGGAEIAIGSEKLSYANRTQNALNGLKRGEGGTTATVHEKGERVELLTTDDIITKIQNVGDMQFFRGAQPNDISALGSDFTKEQQRVQDWVKNHPGRPIEEYNRLTTAEGGPAAGLYWFPHRIKKGEFETGIEARLAPLIGTGNPDWNFTGNDLQNVGFASDELGYPAVAFEIADAKKGAFGDFTEANIGKGMGIVLNGEIATLATINGKLPGRGIITGGSGGFSSKEVQDLVSTLRSGSLRMRPSIESKTRVGATLGDEYVWKSFLSGLVALGLVIGFMLFFYHRLGALSVIGLALNMLYLLGAMAFLQATLTLPGVAGLILTLGMAVDGNILIYERLREELGRGLKAVQAVKAAFFRANVTIIDAHVTQLIAGLVLYYFGTGPIKGFATTLNIGILTTLFTVIIVTELLILTDIKRGTVNLGMKQVLVNPGWAFMRWSRPAIAASLVVIVAGVALFVSMPDNEKLGTDFTGGFTMTVRTEQPQPIDQVRTLVATVPGTIGRSATVVPLLESGDKQTGYRSFRITYKLEALVPTEGGASSSGTGSSESSLKQIQSALAGVLQKGPIELQLTENGTKVQGRLHFENPHPPAEIASVLAGRGIKDASVTPLADNASVVDFNGTLEAPTSESVLLARLDKEIKSQKDSKGVLLHLSNSIPESDFIGAQVGSELRDKAVMAVLLSLVGTMFYIRIRFAEYAYGMAVVISLLHDVLIALGALALACKLQILQAEVDLSMIAAFLTIIGYSQNDTIVIFDRVRENRLKSNKPLTQILDDSINECFGRTILTTATVILTLLVLFLFNVGSRNVLEGFSYCMLVGVISGAYSTIYVACPALHWLENRAARKGGGGDSGSAVKTKVAVASTP